jgi:hypothetical protein
MVSVIEHATTGRTPTAAAWLLSGSTALGLVSLAMIVRTLQDYDQLKAVYRPTSFAMLAAAVVAILLGAWRPAPVLLVAALAAIQSFLWVYAISRQLVKTPSRRNDA